MGVKKQKETDLFLIFPSQVDDAMRSAGKQVIRGILTHVGGLVARSKELH